MKMVPNSQEIQVKDLPWLMIKTNQLTKRAEDETPITKEEINEMVLNDKAASTENTQAEGMEHEDTGREDHHEQQHQHSEGTQGEKPKGQRNFKRALQFTPAKTNDSKHLRRQGNGSQDGTQGYKACK